MRKLNEISVGAAEITHLPAARGEKKTLPTSRGIGVFAADVIFKMQSG